MEKIRRALKKSGVKKCFALAGCRWLLGILFLWSPGVLAQKLIFENIGVRSGLPSTEVYHVFQDSKGYVWVFTEYDIVKYDGSKFIHVCKNIPLSERVVYAVYQKKDGFFYFANSKANIYCVKNDLAYRITGLEEAKKKIKRNALNIVELFLDDQNGLYFSAAYETFYYPEGRYSINGNLKEKRTTDPKPKYFFFKKRPTRLMSGYILDQERQKYTGFFGKGMGSRIHVRELENRLYQTYRNSVICLSGNKVKSQVDLGMEIISFEADRENHLWVGLLNGGLLELDADLRIINHYFDRLTISSILFDNQDGLWVSTTENGIYHCKDIHVKSYNNVESMNTSISMIKTLNGKLYAGTYKGSLFVKEKESFRRISSENSLNAITDIEYCSGKYLVGSTVNLWLLDKNYRLLDYGLLTSFGMNRFAKDRVLVVLPVNIVIRSLDNLFDKSNMIFRGKVRCAVRNKRGEFFIISDKGILRMRGLKCELPKALRKLKTDNIIRLKLDREDNLWLCSRGEGLYCWTNKQKLIHYNNLPTGFVNDVDFTENGNVLIATNLGTFVNRLKTINKYTWNLVFKEESIRINVFDNTVYIGTKFGLNSIRVSKLYRKKHYCFYLKSIANNGKTLSFRKPQIFNYNQNNLDFNYDILNYQSGNNELEYTLSGPTKLRNVTQGTQIQLQNLSPGDYYLKVSPIMTNSRGSNLLITTEFTIRPAFWQTWTFRIVVVVILLSIIFLIFWWINNRRNKKAREINQIENLLTEYRLTALKSQVNPHFMSNSLVAIQRLILEGETDKANRYIAKFSLLLRSLLEYSNRSSTTIRNELIMIELYVELEQLRFEDQFVFEVQIDQDVELNNIHMPALITQPFVENAIWHGLLPLHGKKEAKLVLSVQMSGNDVLISVIDNGVGRHVHKKEKAHREFESRGTSLIIQRLENLNRLYNTTGGRVEYIDLEDESGQHSGTQVNIWLPNDILTQLSDGKNP